MAVATTDVPGRFDVVVNVAGTLNGYTYLRTLDGSYLTAGRHRAEYSSSPTFVERSNVSNQYGDNAQDFFLTVRQRDWSLGEQQKFFRSGADGRYWMGSNVDVSVPGQVKLSPGAASISFAAAVRAGARQPNTQIIGVSSATNLYYVDVDGTITDKGAHGLGASPSRWGVCMDGAFIYLTTTTAGTVGVRRWNGGAAFSTFSASGADSLAFLNNSLYGFRQNSADLVRWDTAGVLTSLFTWKGAEGSAWLNAGAILTPFGGKLLITFPYGQESSEMWIYDGSTPVRLEVFPENFVAADVEVLYGVAYVSGSFVKPASTTTLALKPAVLFFDGSTIGKLWEANDFNASTVAAANSIIGPHPGLGISNGRLIFTDDTTGSLMAYNPAVGGVSAVGAFTSTGDSTHIISSGFSTVQTRNQTTAYYFPSTSYPTSGYVISSLIDFESSLNKAFRGVTVEFDAATDGNGGSVDVAYQLNGLAGSWTSLATGVTSTTEVLFPANISGHSIAVKVTLNKGTSTAGPTVKRLSVRASPALQSWELRTYNLDLTSVTDDPTVLQDGALHPLTGYQQAVLLRTAIKSATPITVTDRFGTFTGVCEPSQCSILELHSEGGSPTTPGQYIATVMIREV